MAVESDVRISVTAAVSTVEDRKKSVQGKRNVQRQQRHTDEQAQTAVH